MARCRGIPWLRICLGVALLLVKLAVAMTSTWTVVEEWHLCAVALGSLRVRVQQDAKPRVARLSV